MNMGKGEKRDVAPELHHQFSSLNVYFTTLFFKSMTIGIVSSS